MSNRSGPERRRAELLKLAAAVADGAPLAAGAGGDAPAVNGLRVLAALSQRMGALVPELAPPRQRPALFQWGHLDVIEAIGTGASAQVYRAYDPLLDIEVALKLSRPDLGPRASAEWIGEARRLARLRHPNVVAVHGVDSHDGRAGLWLDLVDGETLQAYGQRRGPLPARELCLVGLELCNGLSAIHDAGLLHRDLKPANLLRENNGRVLIADFGAAGSAALAGSVVAERGTPLMMAPELLAGGSASVASDQYSLGVVLYWLGSGQLPVQAGDLDDLALRHRQRADRPRALPAGPLSVPVLAALEVLLAPDPAARPDSARAAERLLAQALQGLGPVADPGAGEPGRFDRLVLRDAELAWLQQEQRRALLGRAHPIVLVGESGTGKSALLERFGDSLRQQGGRLLRVSLGAYPPGRRRLAALLGRALDPDLSGRAALPSEPEALARRMLANPGGGALALCLDDLENAEAAEQAQLRALIAALRDSPVLVVGLLRAGERPPPAQIAALVGDGAASVRMLEPFAPEQTEAAIAALLGAPRYEVDLPVQACATLHRLSGGNPFFLTELLRHLVADGALAVDHGQRRWQLHRLSDSLPASLELAALARCQSLPAGCRGRLDAAAVLGERFRPAVLAALCGVATAPLLRQLQPALDAGLLDQPGPDQLQFRHGVIQGALYQAIPARRRQSLHADCARLLGNAVGGAPGARLSLHAERAGDKATAFRAGLAALQHADSGGPPALSQCERLLDLAGPADASAAERSALELHRIDALLTAGRLREAAAMAGQLDQACRRRSGSGLDLRVRLALASATFALGRHAAVVDLLQPLLARPVRSRGANRDLVDQARLLQVRAQAALGDYRVAEQVLATGLASAPRQPALRLELQALYGWCIALQGRLREADEALDGALRMARGAGPAQRANVLRRVHWVKLCRGRYQQAYALALAAHGDFRAVGDATGQAKMSMALGQTRLLQGLPEEALGYFNRTVLRLEDIGDRHCEAETLWLAGRACTELGRLEDADTRIDRALDLIVAVGDRDDEFRFLIERARLRLAQGRHRAALDEATRARTIADELDSRDGVAYADTEIAAALLAGGDSLAALARAEDAARSLRRLESGEHWRADWLLARCRLAATPEQPQAALAALASGHDACDQVVAELDPDDEARRQRARRSRQGLAADYVGVLARTGELALARSVAAAWSLPAPA
jgi:tetratricopeptide (TPR) repeat protein/tRNA A-37 threonylcarbamoyl transferase component Bud32